MVVVRGGACTPRPSTAAGCFAESRRQPEGRPQEPVHTGALPAKPRSPAQLLTSRVLQAPGPFPFVWPSNGASNQFLAGFYGVHQFMNMWIWWQVRPRPSAPHECPPDARRSPRRR